MEEIVCRTNYDYDTLLKFQRFVLFRKKKFIIPLKIFASAAIFLSLVAELVICILYGFESTNITLLLFLVLAAGFYAFVNLISPVISAKKQAKNELKLKFTFTDEEIKIEARALLVNEDVSIKYAYIKEYYEYDNSFYLFISMNQAYIINADLIENSNENMLREFLRSKIKQK